MPTLRVMTYNILYGGVGRERRILDVLSAIHPDVAVFTEVTAADSFEAIAEGVGPHHVRGGIHGERDHPAIVSRWPITRSAAYGPPWASQKWIEATIQPFGGPPVSIHGIHLVPQPLWPFEIWRRWEVATLVKRLRTHTDTPHIVAGDFNTLMTGDAFRRTGAPVWVRGQWFLQGGTWPRWALKPMTDAGYTDCYRACNAHENGFTVPAWDPGARIDYVFASPGLAPLLRASGRFESSKPPGSPRPAPRRSLSELLGRKPVGSLASEASDHLPVWADFEWATDGDVRPDGRDANHP